MCIWYTVGPWQIVQDKGLLREPQIWDIGRMDLVLLLSAHAPLMLVSCVSLGMSHALPDPQLYPLEMGTMEGMTNSLARSDALQSGWPSFSKNLQVPLNKQEEDPGHNARDVALRRLLLLALLTC